MASYFPVRPTDTDKCDICAEERGLHAAPMAQIVIMDTALFRRRGYCADHFRETFTIRRKTPRGGR